MDIVLPEMEEPPNLEEYLDEKIEELKDVVAARPRGPHAQANRAVAISAITATGQDPYTTPFVVDLDCSLQFRPQRYVAHRVPCLTYSRKAGLWITSRGRRMSAAECMRIQGISRQGYGRAGTTFH